MVLTQNVKYILSCLVFQDAQEFFLYLLGTIDKQQRLSSEIENPVDCFRFQFQDRIQCMTSKKVSYSNRDDFILQLPVPMDAATNKGTGQHAV